MIVNDSKGSPDFVVLDEMHALGMDDASAVKALAEVVRAQRDARIDLRPAWPIWQYTSLAEMEADQR